MLGDSVISMLPYFIFWIGNIVSFISIVPDKEEVPYEQRERLYVIYLSESFDAYITNFLTLQLADGGTLIFLGYQIRNVCLLVI